MEKEFFSFLQKTRPEIGLTDVYNLGEIYDADERYALSNIFLDPEGLDQIYQLSQNANKEDIRTIGGLEGSVIHSIALTQETLEGVSFNLSQQLTTDKALGEPGKHSFVTTANSDNLIILNGGIAANNIEYNFLDENGELRTTTVPTSRESLFNSQKDADGRFTSASYPSLFRIRRRSHFNTLKLDTKLLIPVDSIIESPTDTLNIPVYMRTPGNTSPGLNLLQCYATKNSPLVLRVRISNRASFSINRETASPTPFVFGYELKRRSDLAFVRSQVISDSGDKTSVLITINTSGTIGNNTDCMLYIYLDPTEVTNLNLSGMGIVEDAGKDIGLVGFDNLQELNISSNRLSTFPVWLKTLDKKLKSLNISGNDWWNNGIVQYFDYQDMSAGGTEGLPQLTGLQILAYSGYGDAGKIAAYDGSYAKVQDKAGNLFSRVRYTGSGAIDPENGFRIFDQLETLTIGGRIRCRNADFSKIFPNLKTLDINDQSNHDLNIYSGNAPKMKNNGQFMSITMSGQFNLTGGINQIGNTLTWNDSDSDAVKQQFVGQFRFGSVNLNYTRISGGVLTSAHVAGGNSVIDAWSGWLESLQYFGSYWEGAVAFKIAEGSGAEWKNLQSINVNHNRRRGGLSLVNYNAGVGSGEISNDIVNAPQLTSINAYYAGWYGKLFSINTAPSLTSINIGNNNWSGYTASNGVEYILPSNFAPSDKSSKLQRIYLHDMYNGGGKKLEFRSNDLENLPKLTTFYVIDSRFRGKLPNVYDNSYTSGVNNLYFYIHTNRFRDVSSVAKSKRVYYVLSYNQGINMGGCLLPQYNLQGGNGNIYYIHHGGSLDHRYPSNWHNSSKRNKPISPIFLGTEEKETLSGVTWTTDPNEPDKLNVASGSANLLANIMVGDEIFNGSTNLNARVTQVDYENNFIYTSNSSLSLSGATLSFRRAGQDISSYFENYTNLQQLFIHNNRITGQVPKFTGCTRLIYVYLYSNLLTTYTKGTLQNITGSGSINSTPRLSRLYLQNNPLTVQSVRNVIEDAYDCAQYFAAKNLRFNVRIILSNTKYDSGSGLYVNYTQNEIFNQSSTTTDPGTEETITIDDPLLLKYNQLGPGNKYSGVRVEIF
jgi:hypothetical protein